LSVGRRSIQNLSKNVAQGYNEKGDGEGFLVLNYRTNSYPLRCNLVLVNSIELRTIETHLCMVQRTPYAVARRPLSDDLLINQKFVSDVENCLGAALLSFLLMSSSP